MSRAPARRLPIQPERLRQAFGTPITVRGSPVSLFMLLSLFLTCLLWPLSTLKIASLVDVLPTLPVTAIIKGLYLAKISRDSKVSNATTIYLNNFMCEVHYS